VATSQSKYEPAEEVHRDALGLRETALGKEHSDTLTSTNNGARPTSTWIVVPIITYGGDTDNVALFLSAGDLCEIGPISPHD
jgi:hypothetical protein